jgi:hypothetical protein
MDRMPERRTLETILTENKLVSHEQLKQIVSYAQAVGIDLYEAVLQKKIVPPDAVMMAYAESIGLPFIQLADVSVDEDVVSRLDPMKARQYSMVPVLIDHGHVLLITTKPIIPDVVDELRMTFGLPVRCAICTPAELSAAIATYYPRGAVRKVKGEYDGEKVAATSKAKPATKPTKRVEPLNAEELKNRILKTVAAFNFTTAGVCFALSSLPVSRYVGEQFSTFLMIGAVLGVIAAGITWKISSR